MSLKIYFCPTCATVLEIRQMDGHERRCCTACGYVHWNNPVPVVAALVEMDSGDLVLVRNKTWAQRVLGLVTGFVEAGEAPEQAVLREVREELGLEASVAGLIGLYSFPVVNQLIIAYHLRASGEIQLGEELEEYKLIPPSRLKPWSFGTGLAVADWLQQRAVAA